MNERRDDWAQAFGKSVGIVAIGSGLLGISSLNGNHWLSDAGPKIAPNSRQF